MSKTILITGSTDGIGLLTATKLVNAGHQVLIHGRNEQKLQAAADQLNGLGKQKVAPYLADLASFAETQRLIADVKQDFDNIDVLINNAGVYKTSEPMTSDNLDIRFVVNTIAPFMISQGLLSALNKDGRIVNLASAAQAKVNLDVLSGKVHLANHFSVYAQSKLALIIWSMRLAKQIGSRGPAVIAINPGSLLATKMVAEGFGIEGKDLNIGADILIKAAFDDAFANTSGQYFDNDTGQFASQKVDELSQSDIEALMTTIDDLTNKYNHGPIQGSVTKTPSDRIPKS